MKFLALLQGRKITAQTFIYFLMLIFVNICFGIELSNREKEYIKTDIDDWLNGNKRKIGTAILPDLPRPHANANELPNYGDYILPSKIIWDPMNKIYGLSEVEKCCPRHNTLITPSHFFDGSFNSLNPRVIFDNNGPVLFIGR